MPLTGPLLTKVNNAFADLVGRVQSCQATYFITNSRYWQGLLTPVSVPTDGADTAPVLTRHPSDQADDWTIVGSLLSTWPVNVEVFVHDGPNGKGYSVWVRAFKTNDGLYCRVDGFNVGSVYTRNWTKVGSS